VRFALDCAGDLPKVDFDREQLRRVLTNLIDNACAAVQAAGAAGEVRVATRYDAARETVRLEVADDGVGIRDEDRGRVFEPYYSTKPHGTGLGLAIVARIVADHHGYVRAQRNAPRGSRFVVELPVRYA
jgi:two-component system nitrogen regulation sensor histidine kinase NtrY